MHCDIDVVSALWAEGDAVCVHPGSGVISGDDAVIRNWRHILEHSRPTEIIHRLISRTVSADLAIHVVTEDILDKGNVVAVVITTNEYR